jgi:undecaprenyl diphosphate synthase
MEDFKDKIDLGRLPEHVAIIMDGNGRWAQQHGKKRIFGHQNGVKSVREVTEASAELGVSYLTLYAFSTENWKRPKWEVSALMRLLVETLGKEMKTLNDNDIRLQAIGDISKLPNSTRSALEKGINSTHKNKRMTLILALNYSGRWELVESVKKIASEVKAGGLSPDDIDDQLFASNLETALYPDPELLIRTSGEQRLSNFLLWQLAYAELYFTPVMWPDFRKNDLYRAIYSYQQRERRFGLTGEQIKQLE